MLRLRMTPSEKAERLLLSLVAAAGANLSGLLGDKPPTSWQWTKILISTVVVIAVNWRAFITNPGAVTTDQPPLSAGPEPSADAQSAEAAMPAFDPLKPTMQAEVTPKK